MPPALAGLCNKPCLPEFISFFADLSPSCFSKTRTWIKNLCASAEHLLLENFRFPVWNKMGHFVLVHRICLQWKNALYQEIHEQDKTNVQNDTPWTKPFLSRKKAAKGTGPGFKNHRNLPVQSNPIPRDVQFSTQANCIRDSCGQSVVALDSSIGRTEKSALHLNERSSRHTAKETQFTRCDPKLLHLTHSPFSTRTSFSISS